MTDDTLNDDEILAENQVYDFVTNQPVKDNPAEQVLQAVARSLVQEYGFDHTQLARDQTITYSLIDGYGRNRRVRRKVSLAVFPERVIRDVQDHIIRACVTQAPNVKANDDRRGVPLLEEILGALPSCNYGLWTNGTDLVFRQKLTGDGRIQPDYVDLYDLPGAGEDAKSLDDPTRQAGRIATGDNLQRAFARVHDYIFGNQGLRKDSAYWQVLNLFFCKVYDEQTPGSRRFWVRGTERNSPEGQAAIARRIRSLFEEVKRSPEYESIFTERDSIVLEDRVLAYAVGELTRYNLSETDVDVKGAAYEEITSSVLKAQSGQFFTPTNVIRLMVEMMDPGGDADLTAPGNWPRILDPACGSGRFLTYALDHVRRKLAAQLYPHEDPLLQDKLLLANECQRELLRQFASECLFGIDFDPDLKRASRMNMILNNDGHGNILSLNSLEFPAMLPQPIGELRRQCASKPRAEWPDAVRARLDADLGTMDLVFTNPPFGAGIPVDDPAILKQYDLAHRWTSEGYRWAKTDALQARLAPEVLFVERCVQWVKPGTGRVAIVLPDGILSNPDAEYIRAWILTYCQVLASIDLPVEAFLPQVGVQASLLFLRRKSQQEMDAEVMGHVTDYPVFMAIAETVGHDRRGNPLYVRDADGADMIFTIEEKVLRRRGGRPVPVPITRQDRRLDDDLPRIGQAYAEFLCSGTVPQ